MFTKIVKDEVYRGYRVIVKQIGEKTDRVKPSCLPSDYWYCGYVEIPKGSRFYNVDVFDDLDDEIEAYGGVTYADTLPETGNFVLGFDCHHLWDSPEVQNIEFTLKECYNLVDQIIEIEGKKTLNTVGDELKRLKERDDRERNERLPYWKQIIEDLTGYEIFHLSYNNKFEFLEVIWAEAYREKLVINIRMDSLRACTHDVIRQTYSWLERN
jgi:hypothetical protein